MRKKSKPRPKTAPGALVKVRPGAPAAVLSESLLGAWRKTVLGLARFPRGFKRNELDEDEQMKVLLKQEGATVGQLWEIFTQTRGSLSKNLLGPQQHVVAYMLGFHLANAARTQVTLQRACERYPLKSWLKERVKAEAKSAAKPMVAWHDFGAGTGAVVHAALEFLIHAGVPGPKVGLHVYDNTGPLLDASRALLDHAALGASLRTYKLPLERLEPDRLAEAKGTVLTAFSMGYVWNELSKNSEGKKRVLAALEGPVTRGEHALVLVVEPGIQDIARDTMELRDRLTKMGYVPLYPCPAQTPCPMLERTRDWCFSEGHWQRPREILYLDQKLGMDRSHLAGGFYLFASKSLADELKYAPLARPIVVGRPVVPQGIEYLVCKGSSLGKAPAKDQNHPIARGLPLSD